MSHSSDIKIYSRLLSYVVPYWPAFLLSIFGFLIYSLSNVAFLNLVGYIVDSIEPGGSKVVMEAEMADFLSALLGEPGDLNRTLVPLAIILIATTRGFGTFVGNYFIAYVSNYLVHNLRTELFDRLLTLPSAFYDRHAMGHLVAKVTFHVTQVTGAATDAVRVIIREGFTVIGYLGFLLYLNWKLTLIFLTVAPLIALLVNAAGKRFRRISERIQDSMGDVTHVASEAVQGYREVRTFGGSEYETERFEKVSQDNRRQSMKMVVTSSLATPAIQIMVSVALAGLVWLVLDPLFLANMSAGDVIIFITTGGLLAKPIRQLSEVIATVQKGLAAAEDIFDLFDQETEKDTGELEVDRVQGRVEFRNVSFSYQTSQEGSEEKQVLKNISFSVEPGETVALVGRSGSGKSTLVSLVPRFYTPDSGQILIDGHGIEEFTLENLRRHIAIVSQQVTLFNDTVLRNIGYGTLKDASRDDIRNASEKAYAWRFVENLEFGLDTIVGDDGVLLSGGQRQRLAIARAFLKDAPILILDEATSALDTESERYIQAALEAVVKGRTTFIVAHRLSTIEKADRIFVIDEGQIVEQGSHQDLLVKGGFYAQLHDHDEITGDSTSSDVSVRGEQYPIRRYAAGMFDPGKLVDAWYGDSAWIRMLAPVSWLYRQMTEWRKSWLKRRTQWQSPVPVVVVGNISVGGTGKSPLVIGLVNHLLSLGYRPGVVSRGYGGKAPQYPMEVTRSSPAQEVGDEPLMIHRRTGVPVVVDPDRVEATQALLEQHEVDVVISDDGLQHYALPRDLEVAVIDGVRGIGNGLCLPAGPLREPPSRLKDVDLVVVNGVHELPQGCQAKAFTSMKVGPTRLVNLKTGEERAPSSLSGENIHAVVGISNPERFFTALTDLGCMITPHQFPDHHAFQASDIDFSDDRIVVMTEKDAVKLDSLSLEGDDYWYLEVNAIFETSVFDALLKEAGLQTRVLEASG
ncbi:MAG: lipid A export permease/ATP-binding protein MsbA [Pseudomonadales bacterium]|nr:lipid A export permease/ATP-binding protein MsbA [Pseudomonadales bacterium]MBO7005420.1 lipid A export permease/ATP-binding protein MsbA [Pseudomonadales bacterium]